MPAKPALISMWDSIHQRSAEKIEWDIFLLPLLFGPVCVLDNMVFDNPGLIEAVRKPEIQNVLRMYADRGLIRIWHRAEYAEKAPVDSVEDLLMIWLTRSSKKDNWTVSFSSLDDTANEELRRLIRSFGETASRSDRLKQFYAFMNLYIGGFEDAVKIYKSVFFPRGRRAALSWNRFPAPLQRRVLAALGLLDPLRNVGQHGGSKKDLVAALSAAWSANAPPGGQGLNWKEFLEAARQDGPEREFISLLASPVDVGRKQLLSAAGAVMPQEARYGLLLRNVVNAAFEGGIAEANGQNVLWPWTTKYEMQEKHEKRDSDENRKVIAAKIAEALDELTTGIDRIGISVPMQDTDLVKKAFREHLSVLQKTLFADDLVKPGEWLRRFSGVFGGGSLSALTFALIPGALGVLNDLNMVLGLFGVAEITSYAAGKTMAEKILAVAYPKIKGRQGMYGVHGGAFYKRGCDLIDFVAYESPRPGEGR